MEQYDFSGWATRSNLLCSDGRTIMKDAFKENDGQTVPLVWNHRHDTPLNILGHAKLENRDGDVYVYGRFNDTEAGVNAKLLVDNGDVSALSIFATQLKQQGSNVLHGMIKEVSLVLAGANPGAFIDSIKHSDSATEDEAIIYTGQALEHSVEDEPETNVDDVEEKIEHNDKKGTEEAMAEKKDEKTVKDVFDTLTEEQKTAVYFMLGSVVEQQEDEGDDDKMKHNLFEGDYENRDDVLSHSEIQAIFSDAKRFGSLKDAVINHEVSDDILKHAEGDPPATGPGISYGITNIDYLFPDARMVGNTPDFISRNMDWVSKFINGAKHLPFSRVKSMHANITLDEARAKGYIKGNQKAEEVFTLLKRTTAPTTIYKKQKLDRDDVIDITDFDVVAWLKREMRVMLDEEIARAALVGDGRASSHDDKINEINIRPIWTDADTYVIRKPITITSSTTDDQKSDAFITAALKARKDYKGSGNPTLFTTEDVLTSILLMKDTTGRVIYDSIEKLKTALRVSDIVTVPVMESQTRAGAGDDSNYTFALAGIILNMSDYSFGADNGGSVSMFDDFDIDFNQMKYLIETRCSGALTKPYSAIVIEYKEAKAAG